MAVTAVTITSGPTVVGRSVTLSGTLDRDGASGTANLLAFRCDIVGGGDTYITMLSNGAAFYVASGTAGTGIAWTWTGTLPEGDYLQVKISPPNSSTLATSAGNVGLVQLRRPLPSIWTPQRDSRGLFVERFARAVGYKDNFGSNNYNRRQYHYATPDGQVYWSAVNNLARYGEYGNLSKAAPTPYGVGMDLPQGWEWPVGTKGGTSTPGGYSTSVITYVSIFYLHNSSKYHDPVTASKYAPIFGDSSSTLANASAYWSNANGEQAIKFGQASTFWGEALQNITVSGIGNGLHCLVIVQCNDTRSNGHRVFLDGQLVGSATYTTTYLGARDIRPYAYWGSLSKSGLDIGSILFQGAIEKFYASDEQAIAISKNPYSYFFRDAPKTSAKRRLFGGVLSLPDPPTEFTSTKAARIRPRVLTQQPQGAVQIDWSHPLARGLTTVFVPGTPNHRDIISGATDTAQYRVPIGARSSGLALSNTDSGNPWSTLIAIPNVSGGYSALTTFCLYEQPDTTTSGAVFGAGYDGTYYQGFTKNSDGTVTFGPATNSGGLSITTAALATNKTYALCGTARYDQNFRQLYVDGVSVGTNTTSGTLINGQFTLMGSVYQGGQNRCLSVYAFYCWRRELSAAEIASLSANPWQIFKPNRSRTYFLPATTTQFKGGRFLPQRWKNQPQGAVQIDWSNPITRSLELAVVPSVGVVKSSGVNRYTRNGNITLNGSSAGLSFNFTADGSYVSFQDSDWEQNVTVFALVNLRVVAWSAIYAGGNFSPISGIWINSVGGIHFRQAGSVAGLNGSAGGVQANKWSTIAGSLSTSTRSVYLNGRLDNSDSATAISDVIPSGRGIGALVGGNRDWVNGQIALVALFKRTLSANEIYSLNENPWQIFKPNPGRIYFLPGMTNRNKFLFLFG